MCVCVISIQLYSIYLFSTSYLDQGQTKTESLSRNQKMIISTKSFIALRQVSYTKFESNLETIFDKNNN